MKKLIIGFIRFYQRFISPLSAPRCRFYPTCSQYALEAVNLHGAGKGTWLGFKRLCRCHPWGGSGIDLVPPIKINWQKLNYFPVTHDKKNTTLQNTPYKRRSAFIQP